MRLASRLQKQINKSILSSFGHVDIFLFGSRVDDAKKGGDIDIAIDTNLSGEQFKRHKIQFIASLVKAGFDLKIDVVSYHTSDALLREEIHKTAIKINDKTMMDRDV